MQKLIRSVNKLKKTPIKKIIDKRISSFKSLGKEHEDEIFKELCFCIMTANFSADRGIEYRKRSGTVFCPAMSPPWQTNLRNADTGSRMPGLDI